AVQRYVPASCATGPSPVVAAASERATARVNSGVPVHCRSFGPNSLKVTLPLGWKPTVTCAVSFNDDPSAPLPGAVDSEGAAFATSTGPAAQSLAAGLLF